MKKSNRAIIIAVSICAVVVAMIIVAVAFVDCWIGYAKLNKVRNGIDNTRSLLISSPLYYDRFSSVAETVIDGEDAESIAAEVLELTQNTDYKSTVNGELGFWDTKLVFYGDDDQYALYLREDGFYVVGRVGYLFESKDTDAYDALYEKIKVILDNAQN